MAAQNIIFGGPPNETLTIKVWSPTAAFDDAPTHSVSATRDAQAASRYKAAVSGSLDGRAYMEILAGGDVIAYSHVTLDNVDGDYVAENLLHAASGGGGSIDVDADGFNLEQAVRLLLAGMCGKSNRSGANVIYRAADDSKPRITASTDASGRTAVTLDPD